MDIIIESCKFSVIFCISCNKDSNQGSSSTGTRDPYPLPKVRNSFLGTSGLYALSSRFTFVSLGLFVILSLCLSFHLLLVPQKLSKDSAPLPVTSTRNER